MCVHEGIHKPTVSLWRSEDSFLSSDLYMGSKDLIQVAKLKYLDL